MSPASRKLVVGNWKMNGARAFADDLLPDLAGRVGRCGADVAVCVPFPLLDTARRLLGGSALAIGAQDVSEHARGAFTGQVSAAMLADFECRYVIVGHSERRTLQRESDALVARKAQAAWAHGIVPIFCVGETQDERDGGRTFEVIQRQLAPLLDAAAGPGAGSFVVAYEPVWAIGTGRSASPEQAGAIHRAIRGHVDARLAAGAGGLRILYGGSVTAATTPALFAQEDIDGALVGGASLVAADFAGIAAASPVQAQRA